jgi:hypothetical protein
VERLLLSHDAASEVTTLVWTVPTFLGGTPGTERYDVIRSSAPSDFETDAACVASDGEETTATDSDAPPTGGIYYYIVRAENGCSTDPGCFDPGPQRTARECPGT